MDFHSHNYTRPPPDLVQGEEEYEVEKILNSRHHGRGCKIVGSNSPSKLDIFSSYLVLSIAMYSYFN
jgi:hypothetical protein